MRVFLAVAVCLFGFSGTASAIPTVSVEFGPGVTSVLLGGSSSIVTASVYIDLAGTPGTTAYGVSIEYDVDFLDNILDFVGGTELLPAGFEGNFTIGCCDSVVESTLGDPGLIFNSAFEAFSLVGGPAQADQKFLIGTLQFHATSDIGVTEITPFFFTGEAILQPDFNPYPTVNFVSGFVVQVPEPGTAALLAGGLCGVALVSRRRRP